MISIESRNCTCFSQEAVHHLANVSNSALDVALRDLFNDLTHEFAAHRCIIILITRARARAHYAINITLLHHNFPRYRMP